MIRDHRGQIPNYVITDDKVVHQWTGLSVDLPNRYDRRRVRLAISKLKKLVEGTSDAHQHK